MSDGWQCPVCGSSSARPRWRVSSRAVQNGINPEAFRPSADRYGETVGAVLRCTVCGHGSLAEVPTPEQLTAAYESATDPAMAGEEPGKVATADRGLAWVERVIGPGGIVDLGCWTGALLVAARRRGWSTVGIEPSRWAVERARERGLDARVGDLFAHGLPERAFDCVAMCDVLEHLLDPAAAVDVAHDLLVSGGALYVTVPDAGSLVARGLGARWWSVLPMHVQYFTRGSMRRLLETHGFHVVGVRSHPKVFTWAHYAGRLEGYSPVLSRMVERTVRQVGLARRPVAPNFGDRMQVLAVRA